VPFVCKVVLVACDVAADELDDDVATDLVVADDTVASEVVTDVLDCDVVV